MTENCPRPDQNDICGWCGWWCAGPEASGFSGLGVDDEVWFVARPGTPEDAVAAAVAAASVAFATR